jgi:hypothetical protein
MDATLSTMIAEQRDWLARSEKGNVEAPFPLAGRFIDWSCEQLAVDNSPYEAVCVEVAGLDASKPADCWRALELLKTITA